MHHIHLNVFIFKHKRQIHLHSKAVQTNDKYREKSHNAHKYCVFKRVFVCVYVLCVSVWVYWKK